METLVRKLTHREDTHQICLCTTESLGAIKVLENIGFAEMEAITKRVVMALVKSGIDQLAAINLFYSSDTFAQLSDANTGLHLKPWQKIYEMFRAEKENQ